MHAKLLTAVLIALAALALAACGGSGSGSANGSPPGNSRSSFAAYAQCLRDHGVKLPSFGGGGGGAPPANPPSGSLRPQFGG